MPSAKKKDAISRIVLEVVKREMMRLLSIPKNEMPLGASFNGYEVP